MAANNKFELYLDFLLDMKYDQAKMKQIASKMEAALQDVQPEIDIDSNKLQQSISQSVNALGKIEDAAQEVESSLGDIEVDVDTKKGLASLEDL